jgi:molecular chaperone DnaK (HSP70)
MILCIFYRLCISFIRLKVYIFINRNSMNNNTNNDKVNISIDFGTCNTVISYINYAPITSSMQINHIIDNITGDVLIPTTLYFDYDNIVNEDGLGSGSISNLVNNKHYYIGSVANEQYNYTKNEKLYFYQFKRFLGITCDNNFLKKFDNEYTVDSDGIYFTILKNKSSLSIIDLIKYYFIGLRDMILKEDIIKIDTIESKINISITVPAYFHDLQRSQFKQAVELAGFNILKMYNEPTAASIYAIYTKVNVKGTEYNAIDIKSNDYDFQGEDCIKFLVYDLGGGTIDTTVIEYHCNENTCEIIDIDGNNSLGGIDIDNIIIENMYIKYNIDSTNIKNKKKVRQCAENIKISLTYNDNCCIILENIILCNGTCKEILKIEYTRHAFNNLVNDIITKMIEPIVKLTALYQIKDVIFIGGPTQIPLLQEKVKLYIVNSVNSSNMVGSVNSKLYKTIVADGACCNYKSNITLLDIIPMNIGIKGTISDSNKLVIMLNKNSKIPTSCEKTFTTSHDCQRIIDIEIYEGVSNDCNENHLIGKYKLVGIPPLKKGAILINLLFKISINGILNVSINGFKNPYNEDNKNFDYKICDNIKLISSYMTKQLLKRLLLHAS